MKESLSMERDKGWEYLWKETSTIESIYGKRQGLLRVFMERDKDYWEYLLKETRTIESIYWKRQGLLNSNCLFQLKESRFVMTPFNIYNFHVKVFRSKTKEEGEISVMFSLVFLCLWTVYRVKCQQRPN